MQPFVLLVLAASSSSTPTGVVAESTSSEDRRPIFPESPSTGIDNDHVFRIIPSMENSGAIALFIVFGILLLLAPLFTTVYIRRRRLQRFQWRRSKCSTGSRIIFIRKGTGIRSSVASFDSFRDEVKRPEWVLSFKRPWETDGDTGEFTSYDSGQGRALTLTLRNSE